MKVIAVNVSAARLVDLGGRRVRTGILKTPVAGRVRVGKEGLAGDAQADRRFHGGPEKAVLAYPSEHYPYWAKELGRTDLSPGAFGENLTLGGLVETEARLDDVYRVGSATLQISKVRPPCFKLALRLGSADIPWLYLSSGKSGFYLRVLEEGEVGAGDAVELLARDPSRPTVAEAARRRAAAG